MKLLSARYLRDTWIVLGAVLFCVFLTARTEAQQYNVTIDTTGLINTDQWAADFALIFALQFLRSFFGCSFCAHFFGCAHL